MRKKVFAFLEQWNMLRPGMRVLAGFSGGADSAALLLLLQEYAAEHGAEVCAVHVDHGIRGEEAARDGRFCEKFCAARGIPFELVRIDVPALAKKRGISLEEAGREARYGVFEKFIKEGRADRAALAHHQNDQAETMLFRLMRGTGLRGLRGMEPVRLPYIRPLLCVSRAEIESWLLGEGISWVEDGSNQELTYTRNQIRHLVLVPMEQIRPKAAVHMAKTAEQLLEIEDFLEKETEQVWHSYVSLHEGGGLSISLKAFEELHPALGKRLVFRCMERLNGNLKNAEAVHAEQIWALVRGGRGSRIMLPGGLFAVLDYDGLRLQRGYGVEVAAELVRCSPPGEYGFLGEIFRFSVEKREKDEEIPSNCYTKWFDYDRIKHSIVLRTRRQGDYLANAKDSHKKLKDYLIDSKVPRDKRDELILLADGSHILWVVGMRISEEYKVTEQTERILKVQRIKHGGM